MRVFPKPTSPARGHHGRVWRAGLVLIALLATVDRAVGQKGGGVHRVAPSHAAPRGKVLEWTSRAGRPFWYRIPKKMSAARPPCLVLMLHGTGLDHRWSFANYPIAAGGFRPQDIVVSPDGLTPGGKTFNFVAGKADGDQIADLIRRFRREFKVGRVYLYGHSQGAFFCYWFVGAHPELVNGIVAHAGNVLAVKHPKVAREKIGIGILHGKADAVVPVSCAYRAERIYREQGYRKVNLRVVDGLTERSGHWPLPGEVSAMLAWLDRVTVGTFDGAVSIALSELGRPSPDLPVITDALQRAGHLRPGYRGKDKEALDARIEAIRTLLEELGTVEASIVGLTGMAATTSETAALAQAHFRHADRALGQTATWKKATRKSRAAVKKHDKAVRRALRLLARRQSKKSFTAGLRALERAPLAGGYVELLDHLVRAAEKPPKGVGERDLQQLRTLGEFIRKAEAEARKQSATTIGPRLEAFRAAHPDWFRNREEGHGPGSPASKPPEH